MNEFRHNSSLQAAWDTSIARSTGCMLRHLILSRMCTSCCFCGFTPSSVRHTQEIYPILFVHHSSVVMEQTIFFPFYPGSRLFLLAFGKCLWMCLFYVIDLLLFFFYGLHPLVGTPCNIHQVLFMHPSFPVMEPTKVFFRILEQYLV